MVALLLAMVVFVFVEAWPSFAHNGLAWFGPGGNVDEQLRTIYTLGPDAAATDDLHVPRLAADLEHDPDHRRSRSRSRFVSSLFVAVFIVEFAPEWMRNVLQPVVRLLASVPSVIYGLLGVLVIVPFIGNHLITESQKASVAYVISLSGYSLLAGDADPHRDDRADHDRRSSPTACARYRAAGSRARSRSASTAGARSGRSRCATARPAIVAGTVLATAARSARR